MLYLFICLYAYLKLLILRAGRPTDQTNQARPQPPLHTANLHTKIVDIRGFDSSIILIFRGEFVLSPWGFSESFESSNLSRDNLSREIGCAHTSPVDTFAPSRAHTTHLLGSTHHSPRHFKVRGSNPREMVGGITCLTLLVYFGLICFLRPVCFHSPLQAHTLKAATSHPAKLARQPARRADPAREL